MSDAQKTPLARSLNQVAERAAQDAIALTGKALPCKVVSAAGGIVKVAFQIQSAFTLPDVTMPAAGSQYMRVPLQPGDPGVAIPSDAMLAGVSGLSSGVADLALQANLSALVFVPISNKGWFAVDGNTLVLYGPDGVLIRDMTDATKSVALTASGITLAFGANRVKVDATGIRLTGPIFFDGIVSGATTGGVVDFGSAQVKTTGAANVGSVAAAGGITSAGKDVGSTHEHSGVTSGGSNTGPPI